ncbi:MAG: TetR family transcriptional regulator [bacterium]
MTKKKKNTAKERILKAAISLFAHRGYSAVGVREIASKAEVNIAMISYYFQGKVGILQEILDHFFDDYFDIFKKVVKEKKSSEKIMQTLLHSLFQFVQENTELALVVYNIFPLYIPEIAEKKSKRIHDIFNTVSEVIKAYGLDPEDKILLSMLAPSIFSLLITHFRFKPHQKHLFNIDFDESFYQRYTGFIEAFVLSGISGIAEMEHNKKRFRNENGDR